VKKAVDMLRPLVNQGFWLAQLWLGYCYEHGKGVPKDETEALRLYRLADVQRTSRYISDAVGSSPLHLVPH
jgi:TPR repeat protein